MNIRILYTKQGGRMFTFIAGGIMKQRNIFHIDVDAFFASAEQSFNPFLRGKPVIVGGHAHQRGIVHTSSYEARAFGVKTGMPLHKARRICPQAIFLKGNFLHYKFISKEIHKILAQGKREERKVHSF